MKEMERVEKARRQFMRGEITAEDYWNVRVSVFSKYRIKKEDEE